MIEKTGTMKQGLPVPRPTWPRAPARGGARRLALLTLGLLLSAPRAHAQDHAVVIVGDLGAVEPEDARAAFAVVLAELRELRPETELRADSARAPAVAFAHCDLARCRASWMLERGAFAVVLLRFEAGAAPGGAVATPAEPPPRAHVEVYDAGGTRVGAPLTISLTRGESGSFREALRAGLAALRLPSPSVAPLLVTCDTPAARVYLDDRPLGVVPLGLVRIAPGRHRLSVSAPGYEPHVQSIDVPSAGARVDVRLTPRSTP